MIKCVLWAAILRYKFVKCWFIGGKLVIVQVCVLATLTTLLGDYGGGFFNHGASAKQEPAEGDIGVHVGNGCNGVE